MATTLVSGIAVSLEAAHPFSPGRRRTPATDRSRIYDYPSPSCLIKEAAYLQPTHTRLTLMTMTLSKSAPRT